MTSTGSSNAINSFRSVFVRTALLLAVNTLVVAGLMAFQSWRLAEKTALEGVVAQLTDIAGLKATALVQPLRFNAEAKIDEVVEEAMKASGENGRALAVLDAEGRLVAARGAQDTAPDALIRLAERALDSNASAASADGLSIAAPVRLAEGPAIGVLAMTWTAAAATTQVAEAQMRIFYWAVGLFVVLMAVTVLFLRRQLGRPLDRLASAVQQITAGDYDQGVPETHRRDELGLIASNLARLVDTLRIARDAEEKRARQHAQQAEVVRNLSAGLDALADGVLTHTIGDAFPEEYEDLRRNFNRATSSLAGAIREVAQGAASIRSGADNIAQASDDLSRRTETQAATLEQTAAALDELSTSVQAAAQGAQDAEQSVQAARQSAADNGSVMQSAVSAMAAIEKSSNQINDIISVIDDIAFQTNLLALNAGVEAARAGSSGKGFAVVASEVRALAQRSSDAARQIKDLIGGSAEQVKKGVLLVERAGEALDDVVTQVGGISNVVTEIARSAGEQAQGLTEINTGVGNLDQVTQQNAAMVEQSTAAIHSLRGDAQALAAMVERFHVDSAAALAEAPTATDSRERAQRATQGRAA